MKRRAIAGTEPVEHQMSITDWDHSRTGFSTALIVLAVPAIPAVPGMRPLNHPAFLQGGEACRARWTRRDFKAPADPLLGPPGVQGVMVILLIRTQRAETRQGGWRDVAEQDRCRDTISETGTGHEAGEQHPQRIDQQMPLAPVALLAAILPTLGPPHLGGLARWALDADGARRGLPPRWHAGLLTSGLDHFCPCSGVAPLGKRGIDGAFGQPIVGEPIPWAATPVELEQRMEYLSPVHRARAPSPGARLGGWDQRCQERPLLVRQIGRIVLSRLHSMNHGRALLC
jgi:hypothetical protein